MFLFRNKTKSYKQSVIRDRPLRSVMKAITWRVVGTIDTIVLSYLVTGKMIAALSIGSFEVVSKMILYFLHERFWAIIRWGRMLVVLRRNTRWTTRVVKRIILP